MKEIIVFTPLAVLDFIRQIPELSDSQIELVESDNVIQFRIDESLYSIDTSCAIDVDVMEDVVDDVEEINESDYSDVVDMSYDAGMVNIQSGILKELAKTLMVGGLVRLTSKLIRR